MKKNFLLLLTLFFCLPIIVHAQRADQKYVEVCGVKWATGNLVYKNGNFQIQEKQWYASDCRGVQNDNYIDHFNFGDLTCSVYPNDYFYNDKVKSICGNPKLDICTNKLGESYRLPTKKELETLTKKANQHYAKYYYNNGKNYMDGVYFTTPEGKKREKFSWNPMKNKDLILTDEDMEKGLFLPLINFREAGGHHLLVGNIDEYKGKKIISDDGYYWSGDMKDGIGIYLRIMKISVNIYNFSDMRNVGMSIRPVYCGE